MEIAARTTALVLVSLLAAPSVEWTALPTGGIVDVECAGDLNGDGTEDLFAASVEGYTGIFCLDGLTGGIIWSNEQVTGANRTGCFRTVGDVDSDGHYDVAIGTASPPSIIVLSGLTGDEILRCPQSYEVRYVESARGSSPEETLVLFTVHIYSDNHTFIALNPETGDQVWSVGVSTLDDWICVTESDVSGNGWSEMGYSVDRSTVMNGGLVVRDGYTGQTISSQSNCYSGTGDIYGGTHPCLAVSSWGSYPVMLVKSITTGMVVWESGDDELYWVNLDFIPNVTGTSTPYPEILAWQSSKVLPIRGDDGYYEDEYYFPSSVAGVDCFVDENEQWRLAVLTSSSLYCPLLVFSSPSIEPSVTLPGSAGYDMCLYESTAYPTPMIGVGMRGTSGPGVCAVSTSAPVSVAPGSMPLEEGPVQVRLLSNPGLSGIDLLGEGFADIIVLDVSGRVVEEFSISRDERVFMLLPAGVYSIINGDSGALLHKAVVL